MPPVVPVVSPRIGADFERIPLQFIPNEGQVDGPAAFYIQGRDKTVYFAAEGLTFLLAETGELISRGLNEMRHTSGREERETPMLGAESVEDVAAADRPSRRWVVKLDFVGANTKAVPASLEESGALISYFKGRPENWKTGLAASSRIVYRELWPGIDLHYFGTVNRLKYEFIVHPRGRPLCDQACLSWRGKRPADRRGAARRRDACGWIRG